jgi:hypothetical protein
MKHIFEDFRFIAEPINREEKIATVIGRVAGKVRVPNEDGKLEPLGYSRAFEFWYGRAKRVEPQEAEAIVAAKDKRLREIARNELQDLKTRIAIMESRLATTDAEFHRETLDGIGEAMRASRGPAYGRG